MIDVGANSSRGTRAERAQLERLKPGTWATRFWLRGYISAGGHVPRDVFNSLWGPDDLPLDAE